VHLHGGRVEARSEGINRGSEFIVRLPLAEQSALPLVADEAPRTAADAGEPPVPAAKRRVLIVDDEPDNAESLQMLLDGLGHDVRIASDGVAALEAAAEFRPEVVFLDIGMPRMNGYEAAEKIRARPWGADMRLIAVTGWGQAVDRQRSRDAGFDEHLVKPVDPVRLERIFDEMQDGRS
jgi:CheY-like chemotaxis protein